MIRSRGCCRLNKSIEKGLDLVAGIFDKPDCGHSVKAFLPAKGDDLWVWALNDGVVSSLVARPFRVHGGDLVIGLGVICTAINHRRSGFALSLIDSACRHYRDQGAISLILWAPRQMLGFYEKQGFFYCFRDKYCEINVKDSIPSCMEGLTFGRLSSYDHDSFDKIRLKYSSATYGQSESRLIDRNPTGGKWHGISRGFPWAPHLGVLFEGEQHTPRFYCIFGYGDKYVTIIEFAGDSIAFSKTVMWMKSRFSGIPIKYNITFPQSEMHLKRTDLVSSEPSLFTLMKPLLSGRPAFPYTTWLDRL